GWRRTTRGRPCPRAPLSPAKPLETPSRFLLLVGEVVLDPLQDLRRMGVRRKDGIEDLRDPARVGDQRQSLVEAEMSRGEGRQAGLGRQLQGGIAEQRTLDLLPPG